MRLIFETGREKDVNFSRSFLCRFFYSAMEGARHILQLNRHASLYPRR